MIKIRTVTLSTGQTFKVPPGIQRIDSYSTHGWQVRCQGTKFFSDGGNPGHALKCAKLELTTRRLESPARQHVRSEPLPHKTSTLPAGISGPIVQQKVGRLMFAELSVCLPQYGKPARIKNIYIGSEATYTPERYRAAEARAIALRNAAVKAYKRDARRANKERA